MKKVFLLVLLAIFAIAAYGQTDSTKVKKKKKIDWVSVHGTVADSFTKMGILDVKIILVEEDSTVIRTSKVYESYGYSSGIGGVGKHRGRQLPLLSEAEERNRRAGLSVYSPLKRMASMVRSSLCSASATKR